MRTNQIAGASSLSYGSAGVPAAALILCSQTQEFIRSCAAKYCRDSNDREDLYLDIVVRLLEYPEPVRHPKQFIRITARNLAINKSTIGSGRWETTESALRSDDDGNADSALESMASTSHASSDPLHTIVLQDTLLRMDESLTPSERKAYRLLQDGFLQADLPELLGISKQAVSKTLRSIREKFLAAEAV